MPRWALVIKQFRGIIITNSVADLDADDSDLETDKYSRVSEQVPNYSQYPTTGFAANSKPFAEPH